MALPTSKSDREYFHYGDEGISLEPKSVVNLVGGKGTDGKAYFIPIDPTNNAIRVNVVAGGAGGGLSQIQVKDNAGTWTDVGYASGNLNVPVSLENSSITLNTNITNTAVPVSQSGSWNVGTELKTDDLDTGTGTDTQAIVGIALPASGGHTLFDGKVGIKDASGTEVNWADTTNDAIRVNVVAGGAGGGVAQTQVKDSSGTWTDVGYATGNLNMPVSLENSSITLNTNITNTSLTVDTELNTDDFDTGTGTDTQAVVGIVLPASGGHTLFDGKVGIKDASGNEVSWADTTNDAIRVNVVAGGAGGGVAQTQVKDSSGTWTDVGYATGNLNMPVSIENSSITLNTNITNSSLTVDTELNTDDFDTGTGTDTQAIIGIVLPASGGHTLWDGSVSLNSSLPAGNNNIGNVGISSYAGGSVPIDSDVLGTGTTTATIKTAVINATASGDTQVVAAVAGKKIRLLAYAFVSDTAVTVKFRDNSATPVDLTGPMAVAANGGVSYAGGFDSWVGETAAGQALMINLSANANVGGHITYIEV